MYRYIFLFILLQVIMDAQTGEMDLYLSGFADTYYAVRTSSPFDFMSSRSRLRTELNISKDDAFLFISINTVYNSILPEQTGLHLREAFFQYSTENWDIKAGRQIITWGVADGLRVTDLVSPMDYTEFLAQDYDDIRVPVNGIRAKYFNTLFDLELVFLPVPEFFIIPFLNRIIPGLFTPQHLCTANWRTITFLRKNYRIVNSEHVYHSFLRALTFLFPLCIHGTRCP